MSTGFKIILALIFASAIFIFYRIVQSEKSFDENIVQHQNLKDLKSTGQVETKSFDKWTKTNEKGGEAFKKWREAELKKRSKTNEPVKTESN